MQFFVDRYLPLVIKTTHISNVKFENSFQNGEKVVYSTANKARAL